MTFKARKRLAIAVLVIGLPLYIVVAVTLVGLFETRPSILVELAIYVGLGFLWMLPLRKLFLGVARPDPDENDKAE
ncbi:DUF2842 domain-containing protein [Sinisalibacter lacisalsi]|uniref:DUF2842 domain-containing protein n=1 Tax=Sinisalibacter lacisalsi TaxID=1526570 RepID=A0ABQ1QV25_9RHOB|nr:DUF2842 domain-containing protein [Sinisalibacter lacisalsi]GGD43713.1 hypothetical protein GCM10011358_29370 [Sinisalibacter lacisalsi]